MRAGIVKANSTMKKAMTSFGSRQFRAMKNIVFVNCPQVDACEREQGRYQSSPVGLAVCLAKLGADMAQETL